MQQTNCRESGYTLLELMMVVVIVAIITAVALPTYESQIIKTKRSLGKGELVEVMVRQEQYFVNNRQYATSLASLGYDNPYSINGDGNNVGTTASDRIYTVQLASATTTSYTLQAIPQLQQLKDSSCGTLQITSTGAKSSTGSSPVDACW